MLCFGFSVAFRAGNKQKHSLMKANFHHADLLYYTFFRKAVSPQMLTGAFQTIYPNL